MQVTNIRLSAWHLVLQSIFFFFFELVHKDKVNYLLCNNTQETHSFKYTYTACFHKGNSPRKYNMQSWHPLQDQPPQNKNHTTTTKKKIQNTFQLLSERSSPFKMFSSENNFQDLLTVIGNRHNVLAKQFILKTLLHILNQSHTGSDKHT